MEEITNDKDVDGLIIHYKGLNAVNGGVYTGRTDGFHLDVNAAGLEISDGAASYFPELQVGISAFTNDASLVAPIISLLAIMNNSPRLYL